jgi:hypothetical protein
MRRRKTLEAEYMSNKHMLVDTFTPSLAGTPNKKKSFTKPVSNSNSSHATRGNVAAEEGCTGTPSLLTHLVELEQLPL